MRVRYAVTVKGIVQGVGFRPFVYGLAVHGGLGGWVLNHAAGVSLEIEGEQEDCAAFLASLREDAPALAVVDEVQAARIAVRHEYGFTIRESRGGSRDTLISPDMGVCDDCLADLRDPQNRRFGYAFTNCTNCGPRFTIIESLPYDRPNTTMRDFPLCADCAREYHDPLDRRFHAQPNACPVCGPQLRFLDASGAVLPGAPLALAKRALLDGGIVAVKGVGGYHLVCDATNDAAVGSLRSRKYRWDKPFAVMLPDLAAARQYCLIEAGEAELLSAQRRPIVLLRKRADGLRLAEAVAPRNPRLGVMLPYTPLHYLLIEEMPPLVMTSGNVSDEPIVYEDAEAVSRLSGIAGCFLTHDRAIFRRCDDSVAVYAAGAPRLLRRSRGYAPQPIPLWDSGKSILACGGEQKNTFCLTRRDKAFLSQHIGDLDNRATLESYRREIGYFQEMFSVVPAVVAYDAHPEYLSTRFAREYPGNAVRLAVQHHHAHLASVLAEHDEPGQAIGLIFDGTGYGADGMLWGGEALCGDCVGFRRAAHLLPLALPGGEQAIREPWRAAMSCLAAAYDAETLAESAPPGLLRPGWQTLWQATARGVNAPLSTGMGRLFDAVAALAGIGRAVNYEGQAAVELEQAIGRPGADAYAFAIMPGADGALTLDWRPVIRAVVEDLRAGAAAGEIALRFHNAVVALAVAVCRRLREETGLAVAALSGGCWQNVYLLEHTVAALRDAGFRVLLNEAAPANDGGLAYGQAAVAAAKIRKGMI